MRSRFESMAKGNSTDLHSQKWKSIVGKTLLLVGICMMGMTSCCDDDKNSGNTGGGSSTNVPVSSVQMNKDTTGLLVDGNELLYCHIYPDNATNRKITWSSDKESVASVDSMGRVFGVSKGEANIKAVTEDGEKVASCVVMVSAKEVPITAVSSISLTPSGNIELVKGVDSLFKVTIEPTDATNQFLTWSVDKVGIIGIEKITDGVTNEMYICAKDTGSVVLTISANDGSNVKTTCNIKVVKPSHVKEVEATIDGVPKKMKAIQLWEGGPYWAEFNIGATIEDYGSATDWSNYVNGITHKLNAGIDTATFKSWVGNYYNWGKTVEHTKANSSNYCTNEKLTAYSRVNIEWWVVEDTIGDAAKKVWGDAWRMPSHQELMGLVPGGKVDTCWKDGVNKKFRGSSIPGMCFCGKKGGDYESDTLFFPAAGYCDSGSFGNVGTNGNCWSSVPHGTYNAWSLYFKDGGAAYVYYACSRNFGLSVRPICSQN